MFVGRVFFDVKNAKRSNEEVIRSAETTFNFRSTSTSTLTLYVGWRSTLDSDGHTNIPRIARQHKAKLQQLLLQLIESRSVENGVATRTTTDELYSVRGTSL